MSRSRIAAGVPVIVEDVNAVVVELVGKEGVRDKELAGREEGQNDHLEGRVDDHDEKKFDIGQDILM